ncbi:VOC family protein [Pyxidicoccus sp. MSG2]|uniref:VOC family protein n=1 Tax=Pyxidicoccus sp. MSG2 TaxID=2996790 RepID=UPI00226F37D8|nr:VOC family protein [Pyxidicoccus sp. MSG2]MCY1021660.1 VOC family protein [Pyxidicoccus sp. MSG2]
MRSNCALAYLGIEARSPDDWHVFLEDGLGLDVSWRESYLVGRLDERACRLLIHQGPRDDLTLVGWECGSERDAEARVAGFRDRGAAVTRGTSLEAKLRGMEGFFSLRERNGLVFELAWGAHAEAPVRLPLVPHGFVAQDGGLGHVALLTDDLEASTRDYAELLSARLSDHIVDRELGLVPMRVRFLRTNPRHHSLALVRASLPFNPLPRGIHHMMLQMASPDDVQDAFARLRRHGFIISRTMGKHPNDRVTSFYVRSPSMFDVEVGSGAITVDDEDTWAPREYQGISLWGHSLRSMPVGEMVRVGLGRLFKKGHR